jgi:endoglucanase
MASKPLTQLGRGMNLGNALEAPKEGDWGIVLQPSDFEAIQAAGFTTVRVPVRWSAHAASKSPYGIDPAFLTRVDKVVAMAKAYELTVVLDMHSYDELYANPSAEEPKYLWLWKQIAWHYSNEPETLAFELLNEPHGALDARKWNALLGKAIAAVRSLDPTRTLIIDGPNNSAASELAKLTLPAKDEHVVGTFHLYTPMLFTHQGASFAGPEYSTTGVQWPGPPSAPMAPAGTAGLVGWVQNWFSDYSTLPAETNPAGPEAIRKDFDQATAWAELTGHPVWLGEFGVYEQADMASRAAWTRFVREEAEQRGMPWAYWEFGAGFGAYDRTAGAWKEPLKAALLD